MAEKPKEETPKDSEKPKEDDKSKLSGTDKPKDGEKKEGEVDKDYVIFHFPGVEQLDGTSSGCETLKIPRESAIGLVKKVRPAVARLVERCPCNDPAPEPPEAVVPCVDCMAELKEEARRLSTQAMVQTPISNMSLQQPCPYKPQSLTMMQNCPIPPHAPPLPDTITKQLSFIRISCGKCGADQITDPAKEVPKAAGAAAAAPKAPAAGTASTSGPCTGGTVNLAIPATNSHIQFTCKCLEQQQQAAGAPQPAALPHAANCCYGLGYPPPAGSSPRQGHHERARDRLLSEERRLTQRYEREDCAVGRMSRVGSGRESYQELEERRVYGPGARQGRLEDDERDDDRYALRRTSSGSVEVIGNDNYKVRVSLGGGGGGGRSRRSLGR